jgi:hypothetical protein
VPKCAKICRSVKLSLFFIPLHTNLARGVTIVKFRLYNSHNSIVLPFPKKEQGFPFWWSDGQVVNTVVTAHCYLSMLVCSGNCGGDTCVWGGEAKHAAELLRGKVGNTVREIVA